MDDLTGSINLEDLDEPTRYLIERAEEEKDTVFPTNIVMVTLGDRVTAYVKSYDGFEAKNYAVCLMTTYFQRTLLLNSTIH